MRSQRKLVCSLGVFLMCCILSAAQDVNVTASISLDNSGKKHKTDDASNVVVWLSPIGTLPDNPPMQGSARPRLVQKDKSFHPHVLVVPVGTAVEFPNHDPFFHNVFSLFDGKRFDLGLYEAGTTRDVLFDKPGISYIFCNIHAEMSAVVIALTTPYYAISNPRGQVTISRVPPGRYAMHVWQEEALPEALNAMTREVTISSEARALGALRVPIVAAIQSHKNMYGLDYPPASPNTPSYERK